MRGRIVVAICAAGGPNVLQQQARFDAFLIASSGSGRTRRSA